MTPEGFSEKHPDLRLAWDSTTLAAFMRDPLSYYWTYGCGYQSVSKSRALVWGTLWHECIAEFRKARVIKGYTRKTYNTGTMPLTPELEHAVESAMIEINEDDALIVAIRFALKRAAELDLMNSPGNKDDDKKRSTYTLVRALVWYAAKYRNDRLRPIVDSEGKLMIEQHFVLPMGISCIHKPDLWPGNPIKEDYYLCGSLDEGTQDETGDKFVLERKSTTTTVADYYFYQHDPSVQIYTYDLIGSKIFPDSPLRGVVVEACQTAVGFARFERHEVIRIPEQRAHWLETIQYWVKQAEQCALSGYWPMNPAGHTFKSTARDIQRRAPSSWPALLKTDYCKQPLWNPLEPK